MVLRQSIDNDSIYYLMSRGLNKKESTKLLINGFLNEVVDSIKSNSIRKFIHKKIENQLHNIKTLNQNFQYSNKKLMVSLWSI